MAATVYVRDHCFADHHQSTASSSSSSSSDKTVDRRKLGFRLLFFKNSRQKPACRNMLLKDNMNVLLMIPLISFQFLITIDKASEQLASGLSPYISLEIRDLGADLIVHPWDFEAYVGLGFIQLLDNHWEGITTLFVFLFPLFRNASA